MAEQNKRKKCINCGLLIDKEKEKCPYCGFKQPTTKSRQLEKPTDFVDIEDRKENKKDMKMPKKIRKGQDIHWAKHMVLFLVGCFGNFVITTIITIAFIIILAINDPSILTSTKSILEYSGPLTFVSYGALFVTLMLIAFKDIPTLFKGFGKLKTYLKGFIYFIIGIGFQFVYSLLINLIVPGSSGSNENQVAVQQMVIDFPVLSIIFIAFVGPICEELTYRVGLFGWINKKSRVWAYIVSSLVFGLMHFIGADFSNILIELVNLPPYIVMGLVFAYAYDHDGVESSMTAHILTNLTAIIEILILNAIQ